MDVIREEKEFANVDTVSNKGEKVDTDIASEKEQEMKWDASDGSNAKIQRVSATSKHEEVNDFEFKSRSQLVYFIASYTITGDDFGRMQDVADVDNKLTLYHLLIIYAVFTIPLLFMEMFLGQYSKLNCLSFGKITPIAFGLGITMILLGMIQISYSSCMLGDVILYAFRCVQVPWLNCRKSTENMINEYKCISLPKSHEQGSDLWSENPNARLSSYIYWRNEILGTNDTSTDLFGDIVTSRLICLICIWLIVCILLLTGIGGLYFTSPVQLKCLSIHVVMVVRLFVLTFETVSVLWLYTFPRLCDDIHFLYGSQPAVYWKLTWAFLPFLLLMVLILYSIDKHKYPHCDIWISILVYIFYLLPIFIGAFYKLYKNLRKHNLVAVLKPEDDWGQRDPEIRKLRNTMNPRLETRLYRRSYKCRHKCLTRSVYLKKVIAEEEKWYNVYLEKEDSIGTKSEESESSEEEENEDMMGEAAAAYSLYSELSSVTLKSATDVARVTFVRSDPAAGTSSGNK